MFLIGHGTVPMVGNAVEEAREAARGFALFATRNGRPLPANLRLLGEGALMLAFVECTGSRAAHVEP